MQSTADLNVVDPALTALWPQDRSPGLHGPALPDMDFRNGASSDFSPNIVSGSRSTSLVEDMVRLQAEAAGDDFLLDLGGAAEVLPSQRCNRCRPRPASMQLLPMVRSPASSNGWQIP